ncbi:three component ABC system middle component [[Kitasatospora] papulosa]|uniref:three component ABC system middle component n=1 Tax=[Kitasatospora] papulosa TaxID=1464011 RepID=UPI0039082406
MTAWANRSPIAAAMLNPALVAAVLATAAQGYEKETGQGMPWSLSFVVAPMVLHQSTRQALPTSTRTHLAVWAGKNPLVRAGFPARAQALWTRSRKLRGSASRTGPSRSRAVADCTPPTSDHADTDLPDNNSTKCYAKRAGGAVARQSRQPGDCICRPGRDTLSRCNCSRSSCTAGQGTDRSWSSPPAP